MPDLSMTRGPRPWFSFLTATILVLFVTGCIGATSAHAQNRKPPKHVKNKKSLSKRTKAKSTSARKPARKGTRRPTQKSTRTARRNDRKTVSGIGGKTRRLTARETIAASARLKALGQNVQASRRQTTHLYRRLGDVRNRLWLRKNPEFQRPYSQLRASLERPHRVIATGKRIKDIDRVVKAYKGKEHEWRKISSRSVKVGKAKLEIHAYKNIRTGKIVEAKPKVNGRDPSLRN